MLNIIKNIWVVLTRPMHYGSNPAFHPLPIIGQRVQAVEGCFWNRPTWTGVIVGFESKQDNRFYFVKIKKDCGGFHDVLFSVKRHKVYYADGRMQRNRHDEYDAKWITKVG